MKKTMLLAAMLAIAVLMMAAAPAMADDRHEVSQHNEQEADSGDVDQSFDVSGGGNNSNQTVGLQSVANTGNAQNQIDFLDFGDGFDDFDRNDFDRDRFDRFFFDRDDFDRFDGNDDFEFEDSGASIEVSPTNTTSGDQQVKQAASAFGR
jgi:protein involved in sex pheromone biosynthesis